MTATCGLRNDGGRELNRSEHTPFSVRSAAPGSLPRVASMQGREDDADGWCLAAGRSGTRIDRVLRISSPEGWGGGGRSSTCQTAGSTHRRGRNHAPNPDEEPGRERQRPGVAGMRPRLGRGRSRYAMCRSLAPRRSPYHHGLRPAPPERRPPRRLRRHRLRHQRLRHGTRDSGDALAHSRAVRARGQTRSTAALAPTTMRQRPRGIRQFLGTAGGGGGWSSGTFATARCGPTSCASASTDGRRVRRDPLTRDRHPRLCRSRLARDRRVVLGRAPPQGWHEPGVMDADRSHWGGGFVARSAAQPHEQCTGEAPNPARMGGRSCAPVAGKVPVGSIDGVVAGAVVVVVVGRCRRGGNGPVGVCRSSNSRGPGVNLFPV